MGTTESAPAGYGTATEIVDRIQEQAEKLVAGMNPGLAWTADEFIEKAGITFSAMMIKFLTAMRDEGRQDIARAVVVQMLTEMAQPSAAEIVLRGLGG